MSVLKGLLVCVGRGKRCLQPPKVIVLPMHRQVPPALTSAEVFIDVEVEWSEAARHECHVVVDAGVVRTADEPEGKADERCRSSKRGSTRRGEVRRQCAWILTPRELAS